MERGEEPGFEDWRVEEVLGIVLDDGLPTSLRTSYIREFVKMCRDHPSEIVENERAMTSAVPRSAPAQFPDPPVTTMSSAHDRAEVSREV